MKNLAFSATLLLALSLPFTGCRKEGAAERAGETLDGTKNHPIRDAVNPDGVGEKVGKKVDRATD